MVIESFMATHMQQFRQIGRALLVVLFGDFNGVQVFLAPITILYLIQSHSILSSLTNLFSMRLHFFPLIIFLIFMVFILFMIAKLRILDYSGKGQFIGRVIEINLSVLTLVIIALMYYALSAFFAYFYGIKGTLKPGLAIIFKLFTTLMIIYYYLQHMWLEPYRKRGYGSTRSLRACMAWYKWHKLSFARFSLLAVALIILAVRLYQLSIGYLIIPCLEGLKSNLSIDFRLSLLNFNGITDVYVNTALILVGLLLSNLIFYPFVAAVTSILRKLNPVNLK